MRKLSITIDKYSLRKLGAIDPKDCELGTLYINISGYGRFRAVDLYNVKCRTYFDSMKLKEWLDSLKGPRGCYKVSIHVK